VEKESRYLKEKVVILVPKRLALEVPDYKEVARILGVSTTPEYGCGILFIPQFEGLLFTLKFRPYNLVFMNLHTSFPPRYIFKQTLTSSHLSFLRAEK
jgi:hypothetical protein